MLSYLRVKIKSLAEEARIIRIEERRSLKSTRWLRAAQRSASEVELANREYVGLHEHRTLDVRTEARLAQLAYAFLRGRPYSEVERPGSLGYNPQRVASLATKYGHPLKKIGPEQIKAWQES